MNFLFNGGRARRGDNEGYDGRNHGEDGRRCKVISMV